MPKDTPIGYTDDLVNRYKKFIEHPVMQKITENDTIELFKDKHHGGFALGIKYTSDKFEKPIESGIYTNTKTPTVKVQSLIHDTMTYIIIKSGIRQRYSKNHTQNFLEAVKKLLEETGQA